MPAENTPSRSRSLPEDTSFVSSADGAELLDACEVVTAVRLAENNGAALAAILAYRFRVRNTALETKGIPSEMLLVNKAEFNKLLSAQSEKRLVIPQEIRDFIDDRSDIRDGQDGPRPNDWMILQQMIEEAA